MFVAYEGVILVFLMYRKHLRASESAGILFFTPLSSDRGGMYSAKRAQWGLREGAHTDAYAMFGLAQANRTPENPDKTKTGLFHCLHNHRGQAPGLWHRDPHLWVFLELGQTDRKAPSEDVLRFGSSRTGRIFPVIVVVVVDASNAHCSSWKKRFSCGPSPYHLRITLPVLGSGFRALISQILSEELAQFHGDVIWPVDRLGLL